MLKFLNKLKHAADYGISTGAVKADFGKIVERSRGVANKMNQGIQYLMNKNKVTVINGHGRYYRSWSHLGYRC